MKGVFGHANEDRFRPEYGDIKWIHRLNGWLEEAGVEIRPVAYREDKKPAMQITQENTMIFWNMIADEMDCIAIMYDQDQEGESTWYFREQLNGLAVPEPLQEQGMDGLDYVASVIGEWCLQTMTLYPMQNVVEQYERFYTPQVPDTLPEDFK